MKQLINLIALGFLLSCNSSEEQISEQANEVEIPVIEQHELDTISDSEQYTFNTIQNLDSSWGYQILDQGKVYINQPHIPAISGNNGFSKREFARITAEFVISKIEQGIMPPTVNRAELDSLGVLN